MAHHFLHLHTLSSPARSRSASASVQPVAWPWTADQAASRSVKSSRPTWSPFSTVLGRMIDAVLVAGLGDHGEGGLDRHVVGIGRLLHILVGDVGPGLAHVVVSPHAATVQTHLITPFSLRDPARWARRSGSTPCPSLHAWEAISPVHPVPANHAAAVELHHMHYNFARPHRSLGKLTTPAMAAGGADHVWTCEAIAALD